MRLGGPNGREVYRGTLEVGQHLKYGLDHSIWVRMGRPLALDITLAGKAVGGLPSSPSNLLLTRAGARSA